MKRLSENDRQALIQACTAMRDLLLADMQRTDFHKRIRDAFAKAAEDYARLADTLEDEDQITIGD